MIRADVQKVTRLHHDHYCIPGMLGSLDCMHVDWVDVQKHGIDNLKVKVRRQASYDGGDGRSQ